jgi:hypothetical protein
MVSSIGNNSGNKEEKDGRINGRVVAQYQR